MYSKLQKNKTTLIVSNNCAAVMQNSAPHYEIDHFPEFFYSFQFGKNNKILTSKYYTYILPQIFFFLQIMIKIKSTPKNLSILQ